METSGLVYAPKHLSIDKPRPGVSSQQVIHTHDLSISQAVLFLYKSLIHKLQQQVSELITHA